MITKELYFKNYGGEITCGELEEYALAEIRNLYISEEFEDSDYFCGPYNWSSICGVYGIFTNLKPFKYNISEISDHYYGIKINNVEDILINYKLVSCSIDVVNKIIQKVYEIVKYRFIIYKLQWQ